MKLDKKLMTSIISIFSHLKCFVTPEGTLYTSLLKAFYGCIQSSHLWYEKHIAVLQKQWYQRCPIDPCMTQWNINNKVHTTVIYVDDLLLITDKSKADHLEKELTTEFNWVMMTRGASHSCLIMQITLQQHPVLIDTSFFCQINYWRISKENGIS